MIGYDAGIIRSFAQKLYDRASAIVAAYTLIALVIGGVVGEVVFGNGAALALAAIFAIVGYIIGSQRAFMLKLQAQIALCQVAIEENTRPMKLREEVRPSIAPVGPVQSVVSSSNNLVSTPNSDPVVSLDPLRPAKCPSCEATIPSNSPKCPRCRASFGPGSPYKLVPL
jgi:hypothetical protein